MFSGESYPPKDNDNESPACTRTETRLTSTLTECMANMFFVVPFWWIYVIITRNLLFVKGFVKICEITLDELNRSSVYDLSNSSIVTCNTSENTINSISVTNRFLASMR